mgnify:FL=1
MNAIIANGQFIEVTEECMSVLLQIAQSMGTTASAIPTPTHVEVPTSAPTPKVYEHVDTDFDNFVWVIKDNKVSYTHKDGTYLHEKAVRKVLNQRLKDAGFSYVDKVWELNKGEKRDIAGAKKFVELHSNPISANDINAIRDKWTEKSAKRANKATK